MNMRYSLWLTGIMAVVFALQMVPELQMLHITDNFKLVSDDVLTRPWILLTAIFLHGGVAHILFNGLGLVMFGSILEEIVGSNRFLAIFFGTGLLSSIVSAMFYPSVLGASGAIFGVIGALAALRPTMTVWVYYIPMPLYMAAIVWTIVDLFGFVVPTGIANAGHLSGLAAGIVAGLILRGRKQESVEGKHSAFVMTPDEFDKWERENMGRK